MSVARAPPWPSPSAATPTTPDEAPFIKQCGVFHLPTCVNNVESLSLVAPCCWTTRATIRARARRTARAPR
ncbi:hypothetical protein M5E87_06745 [Flavonifractor plautii]|nr:hypothetical protein M5E87_06745 [Flavonifractor plautii]